MSELRSEQVHRAAWREWCKDSSAPESACHPQLGTVTPSDKVTSALWDQVTDALGAFGDPVTNVTMVGNVVSNGRRTSTPAHWHAPPVINMHVYGTAVKSYKFVSWPSMEESTRKAFSSLVTDIRTQYTAEIGHSCKANCVVFPAAMLHGITTSDGPRARETGEPSCTASLVRRNSVQGKSLYLGFGTYILFRDDTFLDEVKRRMAECIQYTAWSRQLDPDPQVAQKISDQMVSAWTMLHQQSSSPSTSTADHYGDRDSEASADESNTTCICGLVLDEDDTVVNSSIPCSAKDCGVYRCFKCAGFDSEEAMLQYTGLWFCKSHEHIYHKRRYCQILTAHAIEGSKGCYMCGEIFKTKRPRGKTKVFSALCTEPSCKLRACFPCLAPDADPALLRGGFENWRCDFHVNPIDRDLKRKRNRVFETIHARRSSMFPELTYDQLQAMLMAHRLADTKSYASEWRAPEDNIAKRMIADFNGRFYPM